MINNEQTKTSLALIDLIDALGESQGCYERLQKRCKTGNISPIQVHQQIAASCRNLNKVIKKTQKEFAENTTASDKLTAMENTTQSYLRYLVKLVYPEMTSNGA